MAQGGLDPRDLIEQLRTDNRALRWEPLPPDGVVGRWRDQPVRAEESLDYLHRHWAVADAFDPADAGGGPRGRIVAIVGRLTYRVLRRRFEEERQIVANLVRTVDTLAKRCDELADALASRQVAEAANQTRLAGWLDATPPGDAVP